jgi:SAM-dependent methyltransferase
MSSRGKLRLFLFSVVSLFLELLIIRWMSADIRAFTIFKSFPLATVYVGLGLGFAYGSKKHSQLFPIVLLLFAAEMLIANLLHLGGFAFPSNSFDWHGDKMLPVMAEFLIGFALLLVVPLWLSFTVGAAMSPVFAELPALTAYSVNLAGALTGSILFASLSFGSIAPWLLLSIPAAIMLACLEYIPKARLWAALATAAAIGISWSACSPEKDCTVFWSPYQRLDIKPTIIGSANDKAHWVHHYNLKANHGGYQTVTDLTPTRTAGTPLPITLLLSQLRWMLPYQLQPFQDALIVAAGMGSDVSQALCYGAKSIDAVDIDPVIIQLGEDLNPLHPYQDPRVHVICDDARHYIAQCQKKYDLVVFSHLDSQTVLGTSSSVRLDNYIYTRESIEKALTLLKPNGLLVLSFYGQKDWFNARLYNTISSAAGYPPMVLTIVLPSNGQQITDNSKVFILGEAVKNRSFVLPPLVAHNFIPFQLAGNAERVLTDDWPYLYLENKHLDFNSLAVFAEMLLIVFLCTRGLLTKTAPPVHWQLFFMGAAFMLMELQFISRLSLLFGSTWVTTSIVINGVLVMILCANYWVIKKRQMFSGKIPMLYLLLLLSLLGSYFLPMGSMLEHSTNQVWTYTAISLVTFLPVFMAAMIFAVSFDRVTDSTRALAFNIIGAVIGTLLEYISNYSGINALLLVVIGLYAVSYAFARRSLVKAQL